MKTLRTIILLTGILVAGLAYTTVAQTVPETNTNERVESVVFSNDKNKDKADKVKGNVKAKTEKEKSKSEHKHAKHDKDKAHKERAKSYHKEAKDKRKHGNNISGALRISASRHPQNLSARLPGALR
jgi:hypothetical protein